MRRLTPLIGLAVVACSAPSDAPKAALSLVAFAAEPSLTYSCTLHAPGAPEQLLFVTLTSGASQVEVDGERLVMRELGEGTYSIDNYPGFQLEVADSTLTLRDVQTKAVVASRAYEGSCNG